MADSEESMDVSMARLLYSSFGNNSKSSVYWDRGEKLVERLRNDHRITVEEAMELIDMNPKKENERNQFNAMIRKMRDGNKIKVPNRKKLEKRVGIGYLQVDRRGNNDYIYLSADAFRSNVDNYKNGVNQYLDSSPRKKIAQLQKRVRELERENKRIREE